MRKLFFSLTWASFCPASVLFFNACKKQSSTDETQRALVNNVQKTLAKKKIEDRAKSWLDSQKSNSNEEKSSKIELLKEKLDYSGFRFEELHDGKQFIVLPIKAGLPTIKNKNLINVLLLIEDTLGNIKRGNIVQYITVNKNDASGTIPVNLFYKLYNNKIEDNAGFSFLSITGRPIRELEYKNGILHSYRVVQPKVKPTSNNRPEQDPITPAPVCVDWYWVTTYFFADGHTETTSTFAYQTCEPTSGGSAEDSQVISDELEGHSVSENLDVTTIKESSTTRTKSYSWTFHSQNWGMWRFDSYEEGVHVKVNNQWRWKSLIHKSIAKSGFSVGGVVNCTILNSIAQVGIYNAGMEIWYNYDASALYEGSPIGVHENLYNKSPFWNVNQ